MLLDAKAESPYSQHEKKENVTNNHESFTENHQRNSSWNALYRGPGTWHFGQGLGLPICCSLLSL